MPAARGFAVNACLLCSLDAIWFWCWPCTLVVASAGLVHVLAGCPKLRDRAHEQSRTVRPKASGFAFAVGSGQRSLAAPVHGLTMLLSDRNLNTGSSSIPVQCEVRLDGLRPCYVGSGDPANGIWFDGTCNVEYASMGFASGIGFAASA